MAHALHACRARLEQQERAFKAWLNSILAPDVQQPASLGHAGTGRVHVIMM